MFTEDVAQQIARELFNYSGRAKRLPGECDYNFHVKSEEGNEYLLKISHFGEEQAIIDLQNEVLHTLHASQLDFDTPVLQKTINGEWVGRFHSSKEKFNWVRLFTYVPGTLFAHARPHGNELLKNLGYQLGQLSLTLSDFAHPNAKRYLKWDLKQAHWIAPHLEVIENDEDRELIADCIAQFESETAPLLSTLRHSVIHGDINDYNILVTHLDDTIKVSGFIDFGDLVESSTICELAIALTYAIMNHPTPLIAASLIIEEYNKVFPLEEKEIDVLFDLIRIRLCTSVINSALRKKENPDDPYLVISEKPAWELLRELKKVNEMDANTLFRTVCGFK